MPPPAALRPGDWVLVYQRRGVQYDAAQQPLRWGTGDTGHRRPEAARRRAPRCSWSADPAWIILALVGALLLRLDPGVALVARDAASAARTRASRATLAWTLGCGWFAGAFLLTLWMRALSAAGVPFGVATIGVPLAAARGRWRLARLAPRPAAASARSARAALRVLAARDLAGSAARAVVRAARLARRCASPCCWPKSCARPLYPWDAWSQWATKARVWFELKSMVPFVGRPTPGSRPTARCYTDAAPHYPGTVPLLQVWSSVALGRWDDALVNLPWWCTGVALALAIYGFLRADGLRRAVGADRRVAGRVAADSRRAHRARGLRRPAAGRVPHARRPRRLALDAARAAATTRRSRCCSSPPACSSRRRARSGC